MHDCNYFSHGEDAAIQKPRGEDPSSEAPTNRFYRVQAGDDLRTIAMHFYGRRDFWVFLFAANVGTTVGIWDLRPGMILKIPDLPSEVVGAPTEAYR